MAVKYNLPSTAYTPAGLTMLHPDQVATARREYQRLRRIAEKRLARLGASEFADSEAYRRNVGKFIPLSQVSSNRELGALLHQVRNFLDARRSSVTGQRAIIREQLETLHEHGYTFVNTSNLKAFGQFMEAARAAAGGRLFASDRVAEMYDASERKGIPPEQLMENFDFWRRHVETLNDMPRIPGEGVTAVDYQVLIEGVGNIGPRKKRTKRGDAQ